MDTLRFCIPTESSFQDARVGEDWGMPAGCPIAPSGQEAATCPQCFIFQIWGQCFDGGRGTSCAFAPKLTGWKQRRAWTSWRCQRIPAAEAAGHQRELAFRDSVDDAHWGKRFLWKDGCCERCFCSGCCCFSSTGSEGCSMQFTFTTSTATTSSACQICRRSVRKRRSGVAAQSRNTWSQQRAVVGDVFGRAKETPRFWESLRTTGRAADQTKSFRRGWWKPQRLQHGWRKCRAKFEDEKC